MALSGRHIVVAGAGIGGLAAALALRARGAEVTVLERAGEIAEVGAGLQISPNGAAVLSALGLGPSMARVAMRNRAVVLRDWRRPGEVLRLDLEQHAPGQDFFLVHRADLIGLLATAARGAGVHLRLLQKIDRVEPGPQPVVYLCNGAQAARADLVVGADGLHSRARVALNGEDRPFFTGQVAWRAIVPNDLGLPAEASIYMGPGRHLVCYPLREGTMMNIVAVQERRDWADEGWHHRDDPANLRAAFAGFQGVPAELLKRVEDTALWGLFRHPVAPRWQGGRVALLGDAAHPTLPFLAQGANLALEDAWVLADCLERESDPVTALAMYQARRRDRAVRVIQAANGNAWKYHFRLSPFRELGHLALRLAGSLAPAQAVRQFDWVYRHDVTRAAV
ncbi:FAD-dependent monooxygenase [Pseudodonghicola xiamenensis]|uniref:Monooxygenase n=1 Tax=Pseudodonghicola xiamenensis TaxID=337702 RepID=A0A8J3MCY3_9RHOB|nr:FAD-dependent monooxygenase [Pseudodonghicola xiamenensis]GHG80023.1 monooxygenase [Pseudodonghicola xiamenensis]